MSNSSNSSSSETRDYMQHHMLLINGVNGHKIMQSCVNVTLLTLKGLCVEQISLAADITF